MLKNLINKWFGYRWSLYIAKNGKELQYVANSDSVLPFLGWVESSFKEGNPKEPWSVYLNYNKNHTAILLDTKYFLNKGISDDLISQIKKLDPKYLRPDNQLIPPTAEDVIHRKKIKITSSVKDVLKDGGREITFLGELNKIFRK